MSESEPNEISTIIIKLEPPADNEDSSKVIKSESVGNEDSPQKRTSKPLANGRLAKNSKSEPANTKTSARKIKSKPLDSGKSVKKIKSKPSENGDSGKKKSKSEDESSENNKKKKKWYTQSFLERWLEDPELADWLQGDKDDPSTCYCTCCQVMLKNSNRSMLLSHKKTMKHQRAFAGIPKASSCKKKKLSCAENIARAELLLSCFFTEHQLPFYYIDHLIEVCRNGFHDCKVARRINLKKYKMAYLVQDGIAYHEKEEIAEICRTQKFSIMIDENIDMTIANLTAVVVRFFDTHKLDLVDVLFDTISPDSGNNEDIYIAVKMLFINKNIPLENIIGFGGDNCLSGVFNLLKDEVPTVFGIGCDCHSLSLCFTHAIKMLPSYLEVFLRDIASYFVNSGKQLTSYGINVEIVHSVQNKVQELSSVRWLSYENIINVVLDQWIVLTQYFQSDSKTDKIDTSQQIYATMITRGTKHMLLFLQYILQKVNAFNTEFQSNEFRIHLLHSLISQTYCDVLSCFIDDDILLKQKLSEIDPTDTNIYKNLDDIFLGGKAMALLYQEPLNEDTDQFKASCLLFLIELASQIKSNFPIDEEGIVASLSILDPAVAQDPKRLTTAMPKLSSQFSILIPEDKTKELNDQWLKFRVSREYLSSAATIPQYWYLLRNIKDPSGVAQFDVLSEFMTSLSVLPHFSTGVENIFAEINMLKMRYPNPLKSEAVKDRLIAKQMLSRKNATCCTWEPSKELIKDTVSGDCLKRFEMRMELYRAISGDYENLDIEYLDSE
ncbi:general transcription factor ii-i repeat domain-containing protein 2 [Biomphalaria glabrata]|uniref:Uncharacterized protein LOC106063486 n=1 Tax=Biomphalaria glabrata TaxID=6526 RepID=A0A9W2YZY5_BIOGL|nr:uncharacterized protein LOC106063486 [Biomphalaria glabrata]XP_013077334.2 uncharacterized protein LOC106063486 [Biomphalaria glabrata]XP_013077335.2 uncharacterized protein LOC106063486 [Biomphalaria glabrata]XP_013077337.2 uncharacterized protein LOC106063486 [Biomphalaria glabrata]XP_013077338.2 uncharacterized protein LOC106063486 [Biomphalaria glabrata]XP_055868263.1 uncharacterized protein LOC106063486 [Biomphalaria glabrata]XP_055868264.1 uncharacterized protein LOC106063486 [Biomph